MTIDRVDALGRWTRRMSAVATDPRLDLQRLRQGWIARLARRGAYRLAVGSGWPPTLVSVEPGQPIPALASENVYIHLPFCRTRCPHCPYTTAIDAPDRRAAYAVALGREIDAYLATSGRPPIASLYVGGGTPSLTPELVELALDRFRSHLAAGAEVGVELHPADVTPALMHRLRAAGVTRVSLGIETLRPDLLALLGRPYTPETALDAVSLACAAGFECVDVNLIFGIPGQTAAEAADDAERCLAHGVDQVSAYPLFTFPYTPLGRRMAQGTVRPVGDRTRLAAQRALGAACHRHGLARSSVWSFTRPGVAPYSTVTHEAYLGFGVGAGSKVDGELRFNTFSLDAYVAADPPRAALRFVPDERFRRAHWLYWQAYRTHLDPDEYRSRFGRDLDADAGTWLRLLGATRMARRAPSGTWELTERGAVWIHRAQAFFSLAYIDQLWGRARCEPWPDEIALR
jgi:oxygen-independent coproporphyrinogen-3 oxidase